MRKLLPIELVNYAAEKLGDIVDEVVFLGGAVVGLLVTDTGTRGPRLTDDVDVAIEISSLVAYYNLNKRLLGKGFKNDTCGPICRYLHGPIMIDMMPVHPEILGFANRWYPLAVQTAQPHLLANGITINLINAPCFLGTKMEAFSDPKRVGNNDIFMSRDFEDVIRVIDGRISIVSDVLSAPAELRKFLQERFAWAISETYFEEGVAEHIEPGREELVIERIKSLAAP